MSLAPSFLVDIDDRDLAKLREVLGDKRFRQASYQAVSRTTNKVRTQIRKAVKERSYIKQKYITRAVTSQLSRGDVPLGIVRVTRQLLPAIAYKTRASKKAGVTIETAPGRGLIQLKHAFKATMKSGHEGIYLRAKGRGKDINGKRGARKKLTDRGYAQRLPIEEQFGPPVISVVDVPEVIGSVRLDANREMSAQLRNQLSRFGFADIVLPSESNG